eukprot:TRINITY_DN8984_c0_g1_i1.p1 TRINITY_DN8984_c0_g1~~TRINITY_DN8984_c0_g1_i1.p1  ORF type:complete len:158 (-),score=19.25 TRINITY_DN8984_c0_g1_i1:139-612(-)
MDFQPWLCSLRCNLGIETIHRLALDNISFINKLCPYTQESPLSIAVIRRSPEIIRLLCDLGADPNLTCRLRLIGQTYETTPISLAASLHSHKERDILGLLFRSNPRIISLQGICQRRIRFLLRRQHAREDSMIDVIDSLNLTSDAKFNLIHHYSLES